MHNIQDLYCML